MDKSIRIDFMSGRNTYAVITDADVRSILGIVQNGPDNKTIVAVLFDTGAQKFKQHNKIVDSCIHGITYIEQQINVPGDEIIFKKYVRNDLTDAFAHSGGKFIAHIMTVTGGYEVDSPLFHGGYGPHKDIKKAKDFVKLSTEASMNFPYIFKATIGNTILRRKPNW